MKKLQTNQISKRMLAKTEDIKKGILSAALLDIIVTFTAPNHMIWEIRFGVVFLPRCGLPI